MSRTDKTNPYRVHIARGEEQHYNSKIWTNAPYVGWAANQYARQARRRAKAALAKGVEPDPYRPRHGALWDAW